MSETDRNAPARPLPLVGRIEQVGFPALGIPFVRAKVDTGARTSALHAARMHHFEKDDRQWIRFTVPARRGRPAVRVETPLVGVKKVKSSNGQTQKRFVIKTMLEIGTQTFEAQVTLTNRAQMGYAMLLGRTALRRRYLVDVSKSYLQGGGPYEEPAKAGSPNAEREGGAAP